MMIKSTNGIDILVDEEDYNFLNRLNWYVDKKGYAITSMNNKHIYMHRLVFGSVPPNHVVDHMDRNKLNNQKSNLRAASITENHLNAVYPKSKYGYVGVRMKKGRYVAVTSINDRDIHIGVADSALDAAKLRDAFVYALRGEFALLNFPDEKPAYAAWDLPPRLKRYLE